MGTSLPIDHRLIVLDGETEFAERLAEALHRCGTFEVRRAHDELDLIDEFVSRHTAFVVLDVDMVGERVGQMVRILRSIDHDCRFLLCASESTFPTCSSLASAGEVTVLLKPVLEEHALHVICSAIGLSPAG